MLKSSVIRKRDCWDNFLTDSFWVWLKVGRLYGRTLATRRQSLEHVIDCMALYIHRRIYSTLSYVSPMQLEKSLQAAQLLKAAYVLKTLQVGAELGKTVLLTWFIKNLPQ
jgi:putative transposase|tara:strand:- start:2026 stop:2355 length:330 start_codon:yes stop_codon:yes gene_type:complete